MNQTQVIKLNCQNCGSSLNISLDIERFACDYCGTTQIVERKGGIIQLKTVTNAIGKVQRGTDKTAAELALARLPQELNSITQQRSFRQEQLSKTYNDRWNLQLGLTIVIAVISSVITGIVIYKTLFFITSLEKAASTGVYAGIGTGCVCGVYLFKYFSKANFFGLKTILVEGNQELAKYDEQSKYLRRKIQENYQIANS